MKPIIAQAMVIDRATAQRAASSMNELGDAWAATFNAWLQLRSSPYLVMLAHTRKRQRLRAPLACFAMTDKGLREAIQRMCTLMPGTHCKWALLLVEGSAAHAVVSEELAADAMTEGSA